MNRLSEYFYPEAYQDPLLTQIRSIVIQSRRECKSEEELLKVLEILEGIYDCTRKILEITLRSECLPFPMEMVVEMEGDIDMN